MTLNSTTRTFALGLAMTASALTLVSAPAAFAVEQKMGGVIGCNAAGSKQEVGAVIGGLLGAVAGNNLAKN
ncbi:MAG: peptide-binding protein, partial [Caulobacter sp. 35-67-4]